MVGLRSVTLEVHVVTRVWNLNELACREVIAENQGQLTTLLNLESCTFYVRAGSENCFNYEEGMQLWCSWDKETGMLGEFHEITVDGTEDEQGKDGEKGEEDDNGDDSDA